MQRKDYLVAESVKFSLVHSPQITFEITDACNLKCRYCGYGEFYGDYDERKDVYLPENIAMSFIDYLKELWNSEYNTVMQKEITVSFYGGEPLLNINFIRKIVDYLRTLDCKSRTFKFSMTTNAMLLDHYMDYLVEHDFHLLISLDGNEYNTSYRVDHSGKAVFGKVIRNVDALQEKYPDFFHDKVNFNAVLHNRNSVESIYTFFKEKYSKIPRIGELNNTGIKPDKTKEFNATYRNSTESLHQSEHYEEIEKDMFMEADSYKTLGIFLLENSEFVYKDYNELLFGKGKKKFAPTGTCMPFSKKIYVTVNGKILPCERIGHQYALGSLTHKGVELDFQKIAERYNGYYSKLEKQCLKCYNKTACIQCMFNLPDIEEETVCHGYMSKDDFERYKNHQYTFLAKNPESYRKILEEVINT